jgi:hypothetical protein
MRSADDRSKLTGQVENLEDLLQRQKEQQDASDVERGDRVAGPLFRPGQSVRQWWASWFVTNEAPKQYKKKSRPAWYSGEITSYGGFMSFKYCASDVTEHAYFVH